MGDAGEDRRVSDSDDTPPDRPPARRRAMTSTERDVTGYRARQERARARARSHPLGVPILNQLDELEAAVPRGEFADEEPSAVTAAIERDPALRRLRDQLVTEATDRANQIVAALGDKPPEERMSALERRLRRYRALIIAIAIPAASSTIVVAKYLMDKAAADERAKLEREQLLEHDRDHEARLRALEGWRPSRHLDSPLPSLRLDQSPLTKEKQP